MGENMESYKLVNSKEVQGKAFRLGYEVNKDFVDDPFIILYAEGEALKFNDIIDYANCDIQEITQADFLALPEPLKIGDMACVSKGDLELIIFIKVAEVTEEDITGTWGDSYEFSEFGVSKATQEQIDILGIK